MQFTPSELEPTDCLPMDFVSLFLLISLPHHAVMLTRIVHGAARAPPFTLRLQKRLEFRQPWIYDIFIAAAFRKVQVRAALRT